MKVVVQQPITHQFPISTNQWKSRIENARVFDSARDAALYSFKHVPPPFRVVLKFEDPHYDFAVFASENATPVNSPLFRTLNRKSRQ